MASYLGQDPSGKLQRQTIKAQPLNTAQTLAQSHMVQSVDALPSSQAFQHATSGTPAQTSEHEKRWRRRVKICATIDLMDGCLGWIPGLGQLIDITATCVCVSMFGPRGFFILLEMLDITGVLGAFVPSCTLLAWSCRAQE